MNGKTIHYLFFMAALGLIALTIGSSALLRAAVCMALMLLLALISVVISLLTFEIHVTNDKEQIERGGKLPFEVRSRFFSVLPVGELLIEVEGAENLKLCPMPLKRTTSVVQRVFLHRGVYAPFRAVAYSTDMFGFFTFSKRIEPPLKMITVLPKVGKTEPFSLESGDSGPEAARRYPDDSNSPSGVREWRDGDLLKRVHWKLTMKTYDPSLANLKPMVRTYDEAARPDVIVIPDLMRLDAVEARAKRIEDHICEAALGAIAGQLEEDNPVRLILTCNTPREVEGASIQEIGAFSEALAKCDFDADAPIERTLMEAARRLDRTGAVIVITSRLTLSAADAVIRLRKMSGMLVRVIWITDTRRAEAEALISRLEASDVIAHRENPFLMRNENG
ncbi:MAG: DUF58 domain-containing protein [Clostridia bacterium]|nr:DUF58 domain-containing protein [Clostridia bacterium]